MRDLVAWWRFLNNLNDSSGNGKTLSMSSGSASYGNGMAGSKCLNLSSGYPYVDGITIGKKATITAWAKTATNSKMIFGMSCASSEYLNLYCSSIYTLNIGDGNGNPFRDVNNNNINVLLDNIWHHYALVFMGDLKADLYIDGNYKGTAITYRNNTMSSQRFTIGCWPLDSNYIWQGGISDVRIYNRSLTLYEIRSILAGTPQSDGLDFSKCLRTNTKLLTTGSSEYSENPYTIKGFANEDGTGDITGLAYIYGNQTWTGTTNKFTYSCAAPVNTYGFDEEGYLVNETTVTVTNINTDVLAGVGVGKNVYTDKAYNAQWNDIADCIETDVDNLEYGYCYSFNDGHFYKSDKYMDKNYIGIHSDTAGIFIGDKQSNKQLKTSIAGFVLAYVDKEYASGTPLTCTENGYLTELNIKDMENNPTSLVGTFWKKEDNEFFGPKCSKVKVNNRMWIKVK